MLKLFLMYTFLSALSPQENIKDQTEKSISAFFGNNHELIFEKITLSKSLINEIEKVIKQIFVNDYIYQWKIYKENNLIAYAYLDNVLGKTMPITFLTIIDLKNEVLHAEIIKYRESHGGEVSQRNWLNQFINKSVSNNFKLGDDISSISGATISARSITKGVKKTLLISKKMNSL
ncbi:MAG: FMN-binding protein [Melioribacteraceae bacterium]|nr:FMN-binding protein [Melioribacteraceae bacterium]